MKIPEFLKKARISDIFIIGLSFFSLWYVCADADFFIYPTLFYLPLPGKSRFFVPLSICVANMLLWVWAVSAEEFTAARLARAVWPIILPAFYVLATTISGTGVSSFWNIYIISFCCGISVYRILSGFRKGISLSYKPALIFAFLSVFLFIGWTVYFQEYTRARCLLNYADLGIYYKRIANAVEYGCFHQVRSDVPAFYYHFSPGLVIFIPLIYFFRSVSVLILAQGFFMGITGLVIFHIARKAGASPFRSLVLCLCFLLYPAASQQTYNFACGFHPTTVALPLMLLSFSFFYERRFFPAVLLTMAAVSMQEHVAIYFFGYGFFMMFSRKRAFAGFLLALFSLAYFFAVTKYIMPKADCGSINTVRLLYGHLGSSMGDVALSPFTRPGAFFGSLFSYGNLHLMICLFLPVMFVPFLRPYLLAGLLPAMIFNFIRTVPESKSIAMQYNTLSMAFIFFALVMALKKEKAEDTDFLFGGLIKNMAGCFSTKGLAGAAVAAGFVLSFYIGLLPWSEISNCLPLADEGALEKRRESVSHIMKLIPEKARVASDNKSRIMFMRHRLSIDPLERDIPVDFHVYQEPSSALRARLYGPVIGNISKNSKFKLIYRENGFIVFRRKKTLPPLPGNVF